MSVQNEDFKMIKITLGRKNINDNCENTEKRILQFTARTTSKEVKRCKRQPHEDCFWKGKETKSKEIPLQKLSGKKKRKNLRLCQRS